MNSATLEPFCNPSCSVDNGGCADDQICTEFSQDYDCIDPYEICIKEVVCGARDPIPPPGAVGNANVNAHREKMSSSALLQIVVHFMQDSIPGFYLGNKFWGRSIISSGCGRNAHNL